MVVEPKCYALLAQWPGGRAESFLKSHLTFVKKVFLNIAVFFTNIFVKSHLDKNLS